MLTTDRLQGKKTLNVGIIEELEKDTVKKDIDIVDLFTYFGVTLTKKGASYTGVCPWHEDTNPSLSVDRNKGLYNCFGCGESGDAFTLVEKMKGYNFKESLAFLKEWRGGKTTAPRPLAEQENKGNGGNGKEPDTGKTGRGAAPEEGETAKGPAKGNGAKTPEAPSPEEPGETDRSRYLTIAADYYHKQLLKNKRALAYLESRGIGTPEIITRFKPGYCDGTLIEKAGEQKKKQFLTHGILSTAHTEHFKNCITFPILDDHNQVTGMYGRRMSDKVNIKHLYLKGEHKGVFNRKVSKVYDEIILTESIIDALSLVQLGIENVQAVYGTNGFTDEHLQTLKDDRVKTVVIAFDSDEPGREASAKLKEQLTVEGFSVKEITPEGAKDWNDYLLSGGTKELVTESIEQAEAFTVEQEDTPFSVEKDHLGHVFRMSGITYRVTGVKDMFISNLRVNIKAEISGEREGLSLSGAEGKYYDNLDLYSARSRASYSQNLARAFDIEPRRVERDLITILEYLETERDRKLLTGKDQGEREELTPDERELGLSFLRSPDMFQQIVDDMDILGYVGEDLNKQLMYIAATSRKLDHPISVMVVSESASGKSYLIDTVAKLMPPEDVISATSLSDQALNYLGDLTHKFMSLGEMVHNDTIDHQIREMLSAKQLTRMVVSKEPQTGKLVTTATQTPAIVSLAMSGTRHEMNPENTSRCFMVNADESREQTRRIHQQQWEKKYSVAREHEKKELIPAIIRKHHAAQRLLEPVAIENVFGKYLNFPNTLMRTRRDNERFVDLIACVCFLRQYQKEKKYSPTGKPYIAFDLIDYEIAYGIMLSGVLSSSLLEIPKGTVMLYEELRELARKRAQKENIEPHEATFTQREIREATGYGQTWLKTHVKRLVDYEYVAISRGGMARSKGHYRIRSDEDIEAVNLTMIPTPEELKKKLGDENEHGN